MKNFTTSGSFRGMSPRMAFMADVSKTNSFSFTIFLKRKSMSGFHATRTRIVSFNFPIGGRSG